MIEKRIKVSIENKVIKVLIFNDFYFSPRFKKWLNRFNRYSIHENLILIEDLSFSNEEGIYSFKNSIKQLKLNIEFDENFHSLTSRKVDNDKKFKDLH